MSEPMSARLALGRFFKEFYCLITLAGSHEAGANGGRQCLNLCAPASFGEALFWEGFWRVLGGSREFCEAFSKNFETKKRFETKQIETRQNESMTEEAPLSQTRASLCCSACFENISKTHELSSLSSVKRQGGCSKKGGG